MSSSAIYTILKKRIEKGAYVPATIIETIEVFFAAGSINLEQYNELLGLVNKH